MDIEKTFDKIVRWLGNQWNATNHDVEQLINTNKSYRLNIEDRDKRLQEYETSAVALKRSIDTLKAEHKNKIEQLEQQILRDGQQHALKVQENVRKYRDLIIKHCEIHNIRSPFDAPPILEPIVQKDCEFRGRPATHFGVNRPVISVSSGHLFRCEPVSRFGVNRSPVSV